MGVRLMWGGREGTGLGGNSHCCISLLRVIIRIQHAVKQSEVSWCGMGSWLFDSLCGMGQWPFDCKIALHGCDTLPNVWVRHMAFVWVRHMAFVWVQHTVLLHTRVLHSVRCSQCSPTCHSRSVSTPNPIRTMPLLVISHCASPLQSSKMRSRSGRRLGSRARPGRSV